MLRQSLLRLAASLAVGSLALVALAPPASAHNALRSTDPADGSTVATVPDVVTLRFDGDVVELGSVVEVVNPAGDVVSDGAPEVLGNEVVQAVDGDLAAGEYVVTWRVTSGDGHPIDGTFTFTAESGRGEEPAPTTEAAEPGATETAEDDEASEGEPSATPSPTQDQTVVPAGPLEPEEPRSPQTILATLGILVALGALLVMMIGKQRRFAARTAATRDADDRTPGDAGTPPEPDGGPRA